MGKYITIFGAVISIVIGVWGLTTWWLDFVWILKGCIPPVLILGGIVVLLAGINEIKDSIKAGKGQKK